MASVTNPILVESGLFWAHLEEDISRLEKSISKEKMDTLKRGEAVQIELITYHQEGGVNKPMMNQYTVMKIPGKDGELRFAGKVSKVNSSSPDPEIVEELKEFWNPAVPVPRCINMDFVDPITPESKILHSYRIEGGSK